MKSDPTTVCAGDLLRLAPHLMQGLRQGMRSGRDAGLSVPQFRSLAMVSRYPGASLGDVATHVGLGAPAMSVLINGLVERGLMRRRAVAGDRRKLRLNVTPAGEAVLRRARAAAHRMLVARLNPLSLSEIAIITKAIGLLHNVFVQDPISVERLRRRTST